MIPILENDMFFLKKVESGEILVYKDGNIVYKNKILTTKANCTGYIRLTLNGKGIQAHRLVWLTFNGPIPYGITINHKNGIKIDNRLDNLELATYREQTKHAFKIGLNKHSDYAKKKTSERWSGEKNCNSLITNEQAKIIREDYKNNPRSYNQMAREYNLPRCTISSIVKGQSYKEEVL